ncbi:dimethylaniline monooxygenase [Phellopilus nigrolimitatus]|nr:dimethylaniline monooxygenase [Phellopilus nigrolimitatus]
MANGTGKHALGQHGDLSFDIATSWITALNNAVAHLDAGAFTACIAHDGWLRDLLVFAPDLRTHRGYEAIHSHLENTLAQAQISNLVLDDSPYGKPKASEFGPGMPIVETAFNFETPKATGKGYVRILPPSEGEAPTALCLMMMLSDWKGHEEIDHESGVFEGHNLSWQEVRDRRRAEIEKDPLAIVVGAAQSGLQVAARFRQMGIRTLVLEQTARVGDVWRNRYPTLALHTPRAHHCFLYQPYPSNWPEYTPRDKLAYWIEQYAETQDLVVWTSSSLEPTPKYNATTKRWDAVINRNGVPVVLHPAHIVIAVSMYGDPVVPSLAGAASFRGTILHASAFGGGAPFAGQTVVVVGAGNSAADVCQDLAFRGASAVTMVQRSATAVVSSAYLAATFGGAFPEGRPTYYSDLAFAGMPVGLLRELGKRVQPFAEKFDKEMLEGLKKSGFKLTDGPDHSGQILMVFDRGGGYFIDVGCASLIINGSVKVKQGTEIDRLTPTGVVFADGSEQEADAIILATGWRPVREKLRRIFGRDVIDHTSELWGVDEGGELRAGYKPSGQPGLWFATGDFAISRFYSKFLALFIKGIELGYFSS